MSPLSLEPVRRLARRVAGPGLRVGPAIVLIWFGLPKMWPGASPAEHLAGRTIEAMTGGLVDGEIACVALGAGEVLLGLALLGGRATTLVALVALAHLIGTATPLVFFPDEMWRRPFVGTLEGQYIVKNVVLAASLIAVIALNAGRSRPGRRRSRRDLSDHGRPERGRPERDLPVRDRPERDLSSAT